MHSVRERRVSAATLVGTLSPLKYLVLAALAVSAGHVSHLRVDAAASALQLPPHEALPTIRALDLVSLGYRSFVADYYWLRTILHFGDKAMHAEHYPNLAPFLDRVVALDPYFTTAYLFAGNVLSLKGQDAARACELLERGTQFRPDDWQLHFLLGFLRYYHFRDYARGAESLARAAKLDGAPPYTGMLAARLSAEAQIPEVGITLVDAMLERVTDPQVRAEYEERRRLLELEMYLRLLNEAVERFRRSHGKPPVSLDALVAVGILRNVPPEPLGGTYLVSPDGLVTTTNEDKRLRLAATAKGLP